MKFMIHYAAVTRASYAVEADSADAALAAFRAAGDQRHVFAANETRAPVLVEVEAVKNEDRKVTHFPDGKIKVDL